MSAEATLRPLLAKYIREEDSLNTAFAEPTTDLFSLGFDSMGAFALLDDLAAEGIDDEEGLVDRLPGHGGAVGGEGIEVAGEGAHVLARDRQQTWAGGAPGATGGGQQRGEAGGAPGQDLAAGGAGPAG